MPRRPLQSKDPKQDRSAWKSWGPYLSERQWGTVREDYSANGDAWHYFPHEHARSRAYRWGEDGIAGICDENQILCFAFAFWNGRDPILKERLFGLTGPEGNHGEDVKELYYYLDNTPAHTYMRALYKYPHEYPYRLLVDENARRTLDQPEYELLDTGALIDGRYFDLFLEYAKASPDDILIQCTAYNRAQTPAELHIIPQLWYRNTWSWGLDPYKPVITLVEGQLRAIHHTLGDYWLACEEESEPLFCENETNVCRLYGTPAEGKFFKDGINDCVAGRQPHAVSPRPEGTKAAFDLYRVLPPGGTMRVRLRLSGKKPSAPFVHFDTVFARRKKETDEFYNGLFSTPPSSDERHVQKQAMAGLLWSKQYYCYDVHRWLEGDPALPPPPSERWHGRNNDWQHLNSSDILNMPDKWEYPWYATWDLAFHSVLLARADPQSAKRQLTLLMHDWYMSPQGQFPAYEWNFSNSNPPVQAWAALHVYETDKELNGGKGDTAFLQQMFHKLLLNFTWWVNRKDAEGRNIFQGGFLGLDNIGVFDRSQPLPGGGHIEQADGTSWMATFALQMMRIALTLAVEQPVYQDLATKFFEHFLYIAGAMANIGKTGINLWDDMDEFFYDVLRDPNGQTTMLKVRSMVGLTPLFAVEVMDSRLLSAVPEFAGRMQWFLDNRPDLAQLVSHWHVPGSNDTRLLSLLRGHRMKRILSRMLDESEFLSPYGVRALSRYHKDHPFVLTQSGQTFRVDYEPGESRTRAYGGNSNWRGPVWVPLNYLIIEALHKFHRYYGDDFLVEYPTNSGKHLTIKEVADELARRVSGLYLKSTDGKRPSQKSNATLPGNPGQSDPLLFFEYFHGDNGTGLGASHQTGWTALIADLIESQNHATKDARKPDPRGDQKRTRH
jgi:hypothetical protein